MLTALRRVSPGTMPIPLPLLSDVPNGNRGSNGLPSAVGTRPLALSNESGYKNSNHQQYARMIITS